MRLLALTCLVALSAAPAAAEVLVSFRDGAPVDRFTIEHAGSCDLGEATIVIDLTESAGGLIFDVTAQGAGVNVSQPLSVAAGASIIDDITPVSDGDRRLEINVTALAVGARIELTVDLDDTRTTAGYGATRVSGPEMSGARAALVIRGREIDARFDATGAARIPASGCLG